MIEKMMILDQSVVFPVLFIAGVLSAFAGTVFNSRMLFGAGVAVVICLFVWKFLL